MLNIFINPAWRTKSKAEVDFIIRHNGEIVSIEIKATLKKLQILKSFASFRNKYKLAKAVICSDSLFGKKEIKKYNCLLGTSLSSAAISGASTFHKQ